MGQVVPVSSDSATGPRAIRVDDVVGEIARLMGAGAVPLVYRDRVLSERTRRYELPATSPGRRNVEILHTLLGTELRVGRRRLLCPDLATARYLQVFARIGCGTIAIPYDITQVSRIADELESAWHRTLVMAEHATAGRSERLRSMVRTRIARQVRAEIESYGAGAERPLFRQNTKQRGSS